LFFMNAEGVVRFETSYYGTLHPAEIGDDGIRFVSVDVSYGTEELLNRFNVGYLSGSVTETVTVNDTTSQADYGVFEKDIRTLLSGSVQAQALGESLVFRYGQPQYRIDEVQFNVRGASTSDRAQLVNLDLGDRVRFKWRPNGVGAAVDRSVLVDGISHSVAPGQHMMSLQLTDLGYSGEQELLVGGQVSEYTDGSTAYRLHAFTQPGVYELQIAAPLNADALIVAAGGGVDSGGSGALGGGGAGGVLAGPVSFTSASTVQVVVGEFTQGRVRSIKPTWERVGRGRRWSRRRSGRCRRRGRFRWRRGFRVPIIRCRRVGYTVQHRDAGRLRQRRRVRVRGRQVWFRFRGRWWRRGIVGFPQRRRCAYLRVHHGRVRVLRCWRRRDV